MKATAFQESFVKVEGDFRLLLISFLGQRRRGAEGRGGEALRFLHFLRRTTFSAFIVELVFIFRPPFPSPSRSLSPNFVTPPTSQSRQARDKRREKRILSSTALAMVRVSKVKWQHAENGLAQKHAPAPAGKARYFALQSRYGIR